MTGLQEQTVSINFGQGVDTKTDPKMVMQGKLTNLQNAVFTSGKRVQKRNGNAPMTLSIFGGGTITNPTTPQVFQNELICTGTATGAAVNGQRLFSYSTEENCWVDEGKYTPVK